ncbi:MAG: transposase, partial [bacterium]
MARQIRLEGPGAHYHVLNRGVERRAIFSDAGDFKFFLDLMGSLAPRYGVAVLAYCLMPNHYHIFVRTDGGTLKEFMRDLNSRYSQGYNRRYRRSGPLFQGRYKAVLVDQDAYSVALVRYIHLNPVRAALAVDAFEYRWSSAGALLGKRAPEGGLNDRFVLGLFGNERGRSRARLVADTRCPDVDGGDPLHEAKGHTLLGTEAFLRSVQRNQLPQRPNVALAGLREMQKPPDVVKTAIEARLAALQAPPELRFKLLVYALRIGTRLTYKEISALTGCKSAGAAEQINRRISLARREDAQLNRFMGLVEKMVRGSAVRMR